MIFLLGGGAILLIAFVFGLVTGAKDHWMFKAGATLFVILLIGIWLAIGVSSMYTS